MNRFLLILLLFIETATAQVVSINPNTGDYGQSLNTTITLASGVINIGSPPMQIGDIYLQKGNHIIYASNFTLSSQFPPYDDTINTDFDIPPVVQSGLYDVHVLTSQSFPFPPYFQTVDNTLSNGFTIHAAPHAVSGIVYLDLNQNGIRDTNEHGASNILVNISPGNFSVLTDTSGYYIFNADTGTYTITVTIPNTYTLTSTPSTYSITVPPDSSGNDFGVYYPLPNPLTQTFWVGTQRMRCSQLGTSSWNISNPLPVTETGSITVIHSSNLIFNSSSIPASSVNGDTLRWNYTLLPFSSLSCNVLYNNPPAGDTVWYSVNDTVRDANGVFQRRLFDSYQVVVRCSFDPNDKHASPAGQDSLHLTLRDSEFSYIINFQNTGTDTAYSVTLLDTLDSNLDLTTIQLLGSSDPVDLTIQQNGALRFAFDNILLPDSNVDEPGSHGYVAYRISPLQGLPDSTLIENTAYIYFDFNAPVVTNTTFNLMVDQLPLSVRAIQNEQVSLIYPNPVTQISILNVPDGTYRLRIFDISGREVDTRVVSGKYTIDNSVFVEGVYFYRLTNMNSSLSGKFIVVK